jgi:two-component system, chemotaxis family, sensor kinase CheA
VDELERELKVGFLEEAQQLLQDAEQCFLQIESNPDDAEIINQLFRLAHNLKGSAKAVGFMELGAFTHLIESLLLKIKAGEIKVDSPIVDLLLACKDQLQIMLDGLKLNLDASFDCSSLNGRLENAIAGIGATAVTDAAMPTEEVVAASDETEALELDGIPLADSAGFPEPEDFEETEVFQSPETEVKSSGEMSDVSAAAPIVSAAAPIVSEPSPAAAVAKASPATDESIRVSLGRVDQLINYVGEMVILQTVLFEQAYSGNLETIRKTVHQLGKISKELQDASMSLRMVPLKQTFQKMQRIVRDTSQSLNKKVSLVLQGEETEVEKTVLELIGDPLVHLVRNAVDHGIDSPEERLAAGKVESGTIVLRAFHQADMIVLEVRDDGKGIDANRLRAKALEKGILRPGQTITDKQAINLIFHPGFSTKQEVSDISGRGVGLDVVKTNIERLQGSVEVSTEMGKGSVFRVELPLTLAIIDATTVKLNEQRYAIPMSHIHESIQVKESDINSSVNIGEVVNIRGENLKVYRLTQLLDLKDENADQPKILLVSRATETPFGILVHDISSMQQVVVKKLGIELKNLVGISGSAILGDGKPALILDLPRLIERPMSKAVRTPPQVRRAA